MPAQEHQDPDEKDELSFFLEYPPEVQQNVGNASENKTDDDPLRKNGSGTADDSEDHKAERGQALQNDGGDIVFPVLLQKENGGESQTKQNENDHLLQVLSDKMEGRVLQKVSTPGISLNKLYHCSGNVSIFCVSGEG